jgi:CRP/FNR family transcriptional regulator, cyclic AMP receptor protein
MAAAHAVAMKKKARKTLAARSASLPPASFHAVELSPPMGAPERTDFFDPHLHLTKLSVGKTTRAYQADEFVFSQGEAADAVFYIESGKVKLTVVSKSGKEAVVAILPEGSFFGEGCLAGQPLLILAF